MRIVIDLQAAQASNANRGIGRYSMALAEGIARNKGEHEIIIALSAAFRDSVSTIRDRFKKFLPDENIRVWYPVISVNYFEPANAWARQVSELLREAFLANLKPDVILISSLFEGPGDESVTSIKLFDRKSFVVSILYDLIPNIYPDIYLKNEIVSNWYREKLTHLTRADLQLAISNSSREESIHYLGTNASNVVNISAAIDPKYKPISIDHDDQLALKSQFGLSKPFVLYTGGIDYRKNIEGLIHSFALLKGRGYVYLQLAIVCSISDETKKRLTDLVVSCGMNQSDVVFTGFVPDEELLALYNLCELFIFPSWHEGFGLPALEAMACGRAVIGSNCSSIPEVIGREDALFDPHDHGAIAEKMAQVLDDSAFRAELEGHGLAHSKKFSWDATAISALNAITEKFSSRQIAENESKKSKYHRRLTLAYVSPLPPERSGIADYSADLLPVLSEYYDIDVVVCQEMVSSNWVDANCKIRNAEWLREHADQYDRVLYHFGNSHFHQHMFDLIADVPGVIVLHDFYLSGIISYLSRSGQIPIAWDMALYNSHGYAAIIERHSPSIDWSNVVTKYPCNFSVLESAYGVITHSRHSCELANAWYGSSASNEWAVVPLLRSPARIPDEKKRTAIRTELGLSDNQFIVCSFGFVASTKLSEKIVDAWLESDLAKDEDCVLIFVGAADNSEYSKKLVYKIKNSAAKDRILITGWTSNDLFHDYLAIADLGIQLRTQSRGETSAAVLDCLNYGLATIVNRHGSMADLPLHAVSMIDDDFEISQLSGLILNYRYDADARRALGLQAKDLVCTLHSPKKCATEYYVAIEHFYSQQNLGTDQLLKAVAEVNATGAKTKVAAASIAHSIEPPLLQLQILIDVTEILDDVTNFPSVREQLKSLLASVEYPNAGARLEPVCFKDDGFRYARRFVLDVLNMQYVPLQDEVVTFAIGDFYVGQAVDGTADEISRMKGEGLVVKYMDLLDYGQLDKGKIGLDAAFLQFVRGILFERRGTTT
ncbi:glycosyltransferase [Diaphorobacter aerolatus]|uniref:Glycosyltransferase n=1 Tax=Diaphorobacter aerolatus TaxID=1288495 RepID=A0A7H0GNK9_9BURK|nr:glycosyltransferase [Diaphorobacter aerolatus]QNP49875.1 glycosyltransferase [Diaphorobacter aerolatus]